LLALALVPGVASAALLPGLLSDFEDGTVQGWAPPKGNTRNVTGGPTGNFLEVSAAPRLSVHNSEINGVIHDTVTAISVDLMRPAGEDDLEMRLVLFGPVTTAHRWTSTNSMLLPGDGVWRNYTFSILEADLTRVLNFPNYDDLRNDLVRIMIRYQSGRPQPQGTFGRTGTFALDNVFAVPEPRALALLVLAGSSTVSSMATRRRRWSRPGLGVRVSRCPGDRKSRDPLRPR
jgi:hypothetical protein